MDECNKGHKESHRATKGIKNLKRNKRPHFVGNDPCVVPVLFCCDSAADSFMRGGLPAVCYNCAYQNRHLIIFTQNQNQPSPSVGKVAPAATDEGVISKNLALNVRKKVSHLTERHMGRSL